MKIKRIGPELEISKPKKEERKVVKKEEGQEEVKKEKAPSASKKTAKNEVGGAFRIILSFILAIGAYFTARHYLPETLSPFWLELASLIISLLVLKAISVAYGSKDNRVGSAVTILMLAIFVWQLVQAYADYEPKERIDYKNQKVSHLMVLYPKSQPYVFKLESVGDETGWFTFPYNDRNYRGVTFTYNVFNEGDNNIKIILSDGRSYISNGDTKLPSVAEPKINVVAMRPNQVVEVTVSRK